MEPTIQPIITKNAIIAQHMVELGYEPIAVRRAVVDLSGLSHGEVARKIGVSRVAVTHTLNADRRNRDLMARISHVLGVPLPVLFPEARVCICGACG